jgi:hypothetical protein
MFLDLSGSAKTSIALPQGMDRNRKIDGVNSGFVSIVKRLGKRMQKRRSGLLSKGSVS